MWNTINQSFRVKLKFILIQKKKKKFILIFLFFSLIENT
jgi:hypothetical protein